jgi:hypothetical protein
LRPSPLMACLPHRTSSTPPANLLNGLDALAEPGRKIESQAGPDNPE